MNPAAAMLGGGNPLARGNNTAAQYRGRTDGKALPMLMWAAGGAALLLVFVVMGLMVSSGSSPEPQQVAEVEQPAVPQPQPSPRPESQRTTSLTQLEPTTTSAAPEAAADPTPPVTPPATPPQPSTSSAKAVPPVIETPEDIYKLAQKSVVKIDIFSDSNNPRIGLGSGFIIDTEQRLIVTNYHVVSDAAKADIVFDDGTRFGIEGYVLVEPASDLAVLKANGLPPYAQALQLAAEGDPNPGSQVFSIGHPNDYKLTMRSGLISSVANTTELPEDAQMFLRGEGTSRKDNRWIQHEAEIFGGNSGGPLLNKHGLVLGINTWKDESINGHFALHCKSLWQMLKRPMDRVEPLVKYQQTGKEPIDKLARMFDMNALRSLFTRLELNNWTPQSEEDFEGYSILALAVTVMAMADFDADDPRTRAWLTQLNEFFTKLRRVKWLEDADRMEKLNGFAQEVLKDATNGQGVLMIMKVQTGAIGPGYQLMHGHVGDRRVVVRLIDPTVQVQGMGYFLVPGVIVGTDVVLGADATVVIASQPIHIGQYAPQPRSLPRQPPKPKAPPPRLSPPDAPTSP